LLLPFFPPAVATTTTSPLLLFLLLPTPVVVMALEEDAEEDDDDEDDKDAEDMAWPVFLEVLLLRVAVVVDHFLPLSSFSNPAPFTSSPGRSLMGGGLRVSEECTWRTREASPSPTSSCAPTGDSTVADAAVEAAEREGGEVEGDDAPCLDFDVPEENFPPLPLLGLLSLLLLSLLWLLSS
jgi:hypothetical protein